MKGIFLYRASCVGSKGPHVVDEHTLEISHVLTLSTSHLSKTTVDSLPDGVALNRAGCTLDWWPTFSRDEGWMFYIPPEADFFAVNFVDAPKDLKDIVMYARDHGCAWLLFDCDGPVVEGLFQYEW